MRYLLSIFCAAFFFLALLFPTLTFAVDENSVDIGPIVIKKENSNDPNINLSGLNGYVKYRVMLNGQELPEHSGEFKFKMVACQPNASWSGNRSSWPPNSCGDILAVSSFPGVKYYETVNLTGVPDARVEVYDVWIEPSGGGTYKEVEGGPFPKLLAQGSTTGTIGYSWKQPVDRAELTISPTTISKREAAGKNITISVDLKQKVDEAYGIDFRPFGNVQVVCDNPGSNTPNCRIRLGESGDNYTASLTNTKLTITLKNIEQFDPGTYKVLVGHPSAGGTIEGTFAILDGTSNNSLNPVLSPSSITGAQSKNAKIILKVQNPLDANLLIILPFFDRNGKKTINLPCNAAKCDIDISLPTAGLAKGPHIIKILDNTSEKGSVTLTITDEAGAGSSQKTIGCSPTEQNDPKKKCTTAAGISCGNGGIETAIGCIPTQPDKFINGLMLMSAGLAGGIALLLMIQGSFQMIMSQGSADELKKGREQFIAAVSGLLFIIFSVTLLQIIGVDILQIPGFVR